MIMLSFFYTSLVIVRSIVREKESKLKVLPNQQTYQKFSLTKVKKNFFHDLIIH